MVRRLALASALAVSTAVALIAQQPATLVMMDGERISGELIYRVVDRVGNVGVRSGNERWFQLNQVAIISFVQGDPGAAEVRQLPESDNLPIAERHRFVSRDGSVTAATLDYINPSGTEVTYDGPMGRRVVPSSSLSRIYLNPRAARAMYADLLRGEGSQSTAGGFEGTERTITVPGNQAWTDTGITVNRGDRLAFRANGEIRISRPNQTDLVAPPAGLQGQNVVEPNPRRRGAASGLPVGNIGLGGLIARVGRGSPFAIGSQTEPITMGDSGRLMLGINAASTDGNRGEFRVDIARR